MQDLSDSTLIPESNTPPAQDTAHLNDDDAIFWMDQTEALDGIGRMPDWRWALAKRLVSDAKAADHPDDGCANL